MIRHIQFSEKATASILADLEAAGDGACLRIIPRSDDGVSIRYYAAVVGGQSRTALTADCPDPTNDSHVCPPTC